MALNRTVKQAVQFAGVGLLNTFVNYGVYVLAVALGAHYLVGSVLGYVVSVFSAWLFQYFIVFREGGADSSQPWWRALIKTYLAYGFTGLILNNVLLVLLLDVLHYEVVFEPLFAMGTFFVFDTPRGMAEYLAPFVVMVVAVPINFILNKFWAYGKPKADVQGGPASGSDKVVENVSAVDGKERTMADLTEQLAPYGIDYTDAMDRFDGNAELYKKLALKYVNDEHYAGLVAAMDVKDYDEGYKQAHGLKGVAGNLSFTDLYKDAAIVSDALKEGEIFGAQEHMAHLEGCQKKVLEGLEVLESL